MDTQKQFLDFLFDSAYDFRVDNGIVLYFLNRGLSDGQCSEFWDLFADFGIDYSSEMKVIEIPLDMLPELLYSLKSQSL